MIRRWMDRIRRWTQHRWVRRLGFSAFAGALLILRWQLIKHGKLYAVGLIHLFDVGIAAAIALAVIQFWPRGPGEGDRLKALSVTVAVVTALYSAIGLVSPAVSAKLAAPPCAGAVLAGAPYLAQTAKTGVNARDGASTASHQVNRYGGDCTLGFDGYCLGEKINDVGHTVDLPDERWLLVHDRPNELVAGAELTAQSPSATLGARPSAACTDLGPGGSSGVPVPAAPKFVPVKRSDREIKIHTAAYGAVMVGYAMEWIGPTVNGGYAIQAFPPNTQRPNFTFTWHFGDAEANLLHGTGTILLAGSTCLARDVSFGTPVMVKVTYVDGKLVGGGVASAIPQAKTELATAACAGPP